MRCPYCAEELVDASVVCPQCRTVVGAIPATPGLKGAIFRFAGEHHLLGAEVKRGRVGISTVPIKITGYAIWSRPALAIEEHFDGSAAGWEQALQRVRGLEPAYWSNVRPPQCPKCGRAMNPLGWMIDAGQPQGRLQPTVFDSSEHAAAEFRDPLYTFRCRRCNLETMS
jgi:hypothetical protein